MSRKGKGIRTAEGKIAKHIAAVDAFENPGLQERRESGEKTVSVTLAGKTDAAGKANAREPAHGGRVPKRKKPKGSMVFLESPKGIIPAVSQTP